MGEAQRALVARLLREKIARHGLCRAVGVRSRWLMGCMVARLAAFPEPLPGLPGAAPREGLIGRLPVAAEARGSVVATQATQHGGGLAMDQQTRQRMACHIGERRHARAQPWWANLPAGSREQATCSTDPYAVYPGGIPTAPHQAITKHARKTHPIERFNNTMRQPVSRLVRDPLAFSKKFANHIGAITYFICHYHLTRAAALLV